MFLLGGTDGLELLDGVVETLDPGETFRFGFGHAAVELGVVAAGLACCLKGVEEEVVLSGGETAGGAHGLDDSGRSWGTVLPELGTSVA